jgi:uncharacterized protein YqeY
MNLTERINQDLKNSMKAGDKLRTETIRSIRALILEFQKSGSGKDLNPEEEVKLVTGAAKKRKDSIEQFRNAGREDLATKEEKELAILQEYLPKQFSKEEMKNEVVRIARELNAVSKEDFSKLMPAAMKELKGKADGKEVRAIVEEYLGK